MIMEPRNFGNVTGTYAAGASPVVPEASQIDSKLSELDRELKMLQNLVDQLHGRCQAILNPGGAEKTPANTPRPVMAPLSERIHASTSMAIDVNRGLTDFLARLAL